MENLRMATNEGKGRRDPVDQLLDGNPIAEFESAVAVARATGVSRGHIQKCINGLKALTVAIFR